LIKLNQCLFSNLKNLKIINFHNNNEGFYFPLSIFNNLEFLSELTAFDRFTRKWIEPETITD
jgi:hypothetical protein